MMYKLSLDLVSSSYFLLHRRWMGGPSSHLKQLKGLVRKAHLTLPLDHPKVKKAALDDANEKLQSCLRANDMEHMPLCDREECRNSSDGVWCSTPVAFPPRNWQTVFNARGKSMKELDPNESIARRVRKFVLPEDVMIYQPGSCKRTNQGVNKLLLSMMDNILAIDMQWNHPESKVGILQVASSTFALLVRGPKYWDLGLHEGIKTLFKDPSVLTIGFNFGEIDRQKLEDSFNFKTKEFANFIDLQTLAGKCGYPSDISLAMLTRKVLGVKSHVEPTLDDVDWEQERLKPTESLFASLSVFAIGQVFRQLRHWHALPKRCGTCKQEMGIFLKHHQMKCVQESCDQRFSSLQEHRRHCLVTQHPYQAQLCRGCYRILPHEDQASLSEGEVSDLPIHEMENENPMMIELQRELEQDRNNIIKTRYKESLFSSGVQLRRKLYGQIL